MVIKVQWPGANSYAGDDGKGAPKGSMCEIPKSARSLLGCRDSCGARTPSSRLKLSKEGYASGVG